MAGFGATGGGISTESKSGLIVGHSELKLGSTRKFFLEIFFNRMTFVGAGHDLLGCEQVVGMFLLEVRIVVMYNRLYLLQQIH